MRFLACMCFVMSVSACVKAPLIDLGLRERGIHRLRWEDFPVPVECVPNEDLDTSVCERVLAWWNVSLGTKVFTRASSSAPVSLSVGFVPCRDWGEAGHECPSGMATVNSRQGRIYGCDAVISSDVTYHAPSVEAIAAHELGHCLGLEDDGFSVMSRSVMRDPVVVPLSGAEVTIQDRFLVLGIR